MKISFINAFVTVGFSGLAPKAPGTAGSFVALILAFGLLTFMPLDLLFGLSILIFYFGAKAIDIYQKNTNTHDPKEVVIDELAGLWFAMSLSPEGIWWGIGAFILFRFFDITKPSIIGTIDEKYKNGYGVMGDDMLAGFVAAVVLRLIEIVINFAIANGMV